MLVMLISCYTKKVSPKKFHVLSFKYALDGLVAALKEEPKKKEKQAEKGEDIPF